MIFEEKLAQFGFDMKEYLRRFDDTPQLYQECLTLYTSSRNIDRLCEHYSNGEWEEAQKTAHTLKGSSANLALTKLWDLYSRIVEILKTGDGDCRAAGAGSLGAGIPAQGGSAGNEKNQTQQERLHELLNPRPGS